MGDAMTIRRLIIDSGDRSEGTSESVRGRCTKLLGREVIAPGVIGGLFISYLHWGAGKEGPVATPPSEGGIRGASVAWDGESLGTWAAETLCLKVQCGEGARRAHWVRAMSKMEKWPRVHA